MKNKFPAQDINDANKNKENENVCLKPFKPKEKYVSIETIYNEWFGLGNSARVITGGINSLDTLHPEWHRNNNSSSKNIITSLINFNHYCNIGFFYVQ